MPGIVSQEQAAPQQQSKARKPTKNEQRRAKKKANKHEQQTTVKTAVKQDEPNPNHPVQAVAPAKDDPIQDVPDIAPLHIDENNPLLSQYAEIFAKFNNTIAEVVEKPVEKAEVFYDDDDNVQDEEEEAETKSKLSKKARKAAGKLSVAELKALVRKPEVVEWTDVSSLDPKLLVNIKSIRNVIPVPSHWQLKREYLSSKRGVEKGHFHLPAFIAETGIAEMRQSALDAQEEATLKQKARDRVNPKMNRLDIDYQKLFEAFFRRQTKPHLTRFGEVYYEGKEYETNLRHLRPGDISDVLREALNMSANSPPPWLIAMQRNGCPPSYPAMKIPGVNAPLPPGGKWGFEPGQYGKPPVTDEISMRPLWGGDLFGSEEKKRQEARRARAEAPVSKALWGELQTLEEEEEEMAEEVEEEEEDEEQETSDPVQQGREEEIGGTGLQTPFGGAATPSGFHSTTGTRSMAEEFDLRKKRSGVDTEEPSYPRSAGQVLQERSIRNEGFFGGERAYDLKNANLHVLDSDAPDRGRKRKAGDLDVSVDVDALEREDGLSKDEIRKRYDETRERERHGQWHGKVDQEDLSNMIAEENAKRLKKNQEKKRGR